jgi:hypothetical protein
MHMNAFGGGGWGPIMSVRTPSHGSPNNNVYTKSFEVRFNAFWTKGIVYSGFGKVVCVLLILANRTEPAVET